MKKKFLIDTDCGLDDAMAIMMALSQKDIEVLAITCVSGNTNVCNVATNVFRVLEACNQTQIPVYKGATSSLMGDYIYPEVCEFHGKDGFGDIFPPILNSMCEEAHAVDMLAKIAAKYSGDVTLVTLGPLTNIALTIRMHPAFTSNIKDMFVMGGNSEGRGNVTVSAEFNFYHDPEAAYIVLNEMECPITIAPWEMCLKHHLSWELREELVNTQTNQANLIKQIEHNIREKSTEYPGYILCDQFAMAAAISDATIKNKTGPNHVSCEPQGHYTRGQMIIFQSSKSRENVHVIHEMNMDPVKRLLKDAMTF